MKMKRRSDAEWTKLLADYSKKQVSAAEFCRKTGVSLTTLNYRLRRGAKPGFVRVEPQAAEKVTVELPAGIKLTIER